MKHILFSAIALLISMTALAAPLDDAIAAGHVIEVPTGYIQEATAAPAGTDKLVKDINQRRKAAYTRIAKKNNIAVEQVARESYRIRFGDREAP